MKLRDVCCHIKSRVMSSDIGRRMANGAFWSFTGTALAKCIVLVAGIVCAHILGQEEYGEFNMVRSTILLFVVFGVAGLGVTATKFISEYLKTEQSHISSIYILTNGFAFVTGAVVTTAIIIAAPYLAEQSLHAPHLTFSIRVGALLLFVAVLNGAQQGTLSGFEDFRAIAINTLMGNISESILMLVGGYYYGVTGAILGFGTGFFVLYICNNVSIRRNLRKYGIKVKFKTFQKKDLHLLYTFSLPVALASILVTPVLWCVRTMLVQHDGFSELAIYEASEQWRIIILFIPATVSQVALPILSSIVHDGKERFWKVLKYNILLNASITTFLALAICIGSTTILHLYGDGFIKPLVLVFMALSTIFKSVSSVIGMSIYSRSKTWISFCFNSFWAVMMISFSYLFLQKGLGASGITLALLCSYVLLCIVQFTYLRISVRQQSPHNPSFNQ